MASKLLLLLLAVVITLAYSEIIPTNHRKPQILLPLDLMNKTMDQPDLVPRRNLVEILNNNMSSDRALKGQERLQFLLDYNTKNKELIREMNLHFQKDGDYDWHITLADVYSGLQPPLYVYYRFDRQNTIMLIAGYKRCW